MANNKSLDLKDIINVAMNDNIKTITYLSNLSPSIGIALYIT